MFARYMSWSWRPLMLVGALVATVPAVSIPRLNLSGYPAPPTGMSRWVIQLPGVLSPAEAPRLSPNPADWRVELIVGQELSLDCNIVRLDGSLQRVPLPALRTALYRVTGFTGLASTRKACPPHQVKRRSFVPLAGPPTVIRYDASRAIVVDAPADLQVRWRLWKAERRQGQAIRL